MLESVKKAYEKNVFDSSNPELTCPVSKETIEIYLQILKPAYLLNIYFQNNNSSIADVLFGVLKLIDTYKKMVLGPVPRKLANLLIQTISKKFEHELNSEVYQAAAV